MIYGTKRAACCLALLGMLSVSVVKASVYQWSVVIDGSISPETKDHPRAFLWIPPGCQKVRAVVIADQNMEEEQLFQDESFRKNLADLGFAEVWIAPSMATIDFRFDQNDPQLLTKLLKDLADKSGYAEIENAPLVPMGHSATASWGWDVAAWNPSRVLAVVSLSGAWPYSSAKNWGTRSVDDVPGLTTKGEYEIQGSLEKGWYAGLKGDYFQKHANNCFTQVVEPGDGHFNASKAKIELINLYLRKADQYRLPSAGAADGTALTPMNGGRNGWLYEVWHLNAPPSAPAAPVADFKGKRDPAFWAFDAEMAHAIEAFQRPAFSGRQPVLIGYRQSAGLAPPTNDHAMVHLKFEPIEDGLTFKLAGGFWDKVPPTKDGKPSDWMNSLNEGSGTYKQGDDLPNPSAEINKLTIEPICGPVIQQANNVFAIRFNRVGFNNPKRANDIWFNLNYPGSDQYKAIIQQAELRIPLVNKRGVAQTISFPKISDKSSAKEAGSVQLKATSSTGGKVYYYVREGPAEVDDDGNLSLTAIPPRSKFPISVTVVAWQWGRSIEPLMQSAMPVEQTFMIQAP